MKQNNKKKENKNILPPQPVREQPFSTIGGSKPLIIAIITIVAVAALSLLLMFSGQFVGKAAENLFDETQVNSVGIELVSTPIIADEPFAVRVMANVNVDVKGVHFNLTLPSGISCSNIIKSPNFDIELIKTCDVNEATLGMGAFNLPGEPAGVFEIAQVHLLSDSELLQSGSPSLGLEASISDVNYTPFPVIVVSPIIEICSPGSEICDGLDNDCDAQVDENFDLNSDNNNCGSCNKACNQADGETCINGVCAVQQAVQPVCGNDVQEEPEVCDGSDLNSQTCETKGFASGNLACAAGCLSFDTSGCAAAPAACANVPSGIVSWWRAENNANDNIGSNHGIIINPSSNYVPGKVGQAFSLGAIQYVNVPNDASLNSNQFTLSAWFKQNPYVQWNPSYILKKDGNYLMEVYPHTFSLWLYDGSQHNPIDTGSFVPVVDKWTYYVVTYDGSTASIYVDGVLKGSGALTYNPLNTQPLLIGDGFSGLIDEAAIWNRVLTASEIQDIFNADSAGMCISTCGNGIKEGTEECDDGNAVNGDGCTNILCLVEHDYVCTGQPSVCQNCGNGIKEGTEQCDDGNTVNGDGCSATCQTEVPQPVCGNKICETGESTLSCLQDCGIACPSGMAGWWKGENNANDALNLNDGADHFDVSYALGKVRNAFNFDGVDDTDDFVEVKPANGIGTSDKMTISLWVKPGIQSNLSYAQHNDIIRSQCFGAGGLWGFSTDFNYNSNNRLVLQIGWITGVDTWWGSESAGIIPLPEDKLVAIKDEWNHVVLVMDRANRKAMYYRNGQFAADVDVPVGTKPVTNSFRIAHDCGGAFNGLVDEVSIYNTALTAAEIQNIYNTGSNGVCSLYCGDSLISGIEVCDSNNLAGQTCITKGFTGGNLACAANCMSFNTSSCMSLPSPPLPTCNDGVQNQGETGVDCGGPCVACSVVPQPTCTDGIQNQGETGVDCGGPCPVCAVTPQPVITPQPTTAETSGLLKISFTDLTTVDDVFSTKITAAEGFSGTEIIIYTILYDANNKVLSIKSEKVVNGLAAGQSYTAKLPYLAANVAKKTVIVYDKEQSPAVYGKLVKTYSS